MARRRKQAERGRGDEDRAALRFAKPGRFGEGGRMAQALQAAGLKRTPQRVAIIRELAGDPTHPTAQELYDRLRLEQPALSFATVYNTLAALARKGLCAQRSLTRGPARFDPNVQPHDHAVCDACGLAIDVPLDNKSGARHSSASAKAPGGFRVRTVERIYRGLCADCAGKSAPAEQAV